MLACHFRVLIEMQNGKKMTQVIYRVADHKYIIYVAMPTSVMGQIFGNLMKRNIARNGNTIFWISNIEQ